MTPSDLHLETVDPRSTSDELMRAVALSVEAMRRERMPDDPPWVIDTLIKQLRRGEPDEETFLTVAHDGQALAGVAWLYLFTRENTHLGVVNLSVLAPHRRRGLGRRLLAEVVARAEAAGRPKLMGNTTDRVPAGEAFLRTLGAEAALFTRTSQLDLAQLDWGVLERWVQEGEERAADYTVWLNDGPERLRTNWGALW